MNKEEMTITKKIMYIIWMIFLVWSIIVFVPCFLGLC